MSSPIEVRRDGDHELCGYVAADDGGGHWLAMTIFGAPLGTSSTPDRAVEHVLAEGLAVLAERWTLRRPGEPDEIVCILEANPGEVTVALGYYATPDVPTLTITAAELANSTELTR